MAAELPNGASSSSSWCRVKDEMKKLALFTLAAFAATGLLPVTAAFADGPSDETSFVTQINSLRATKGLAALAVDTGLTGKARAWAQTMADKSVIWHSSLSDGITADWQKLGENVGMGGTVDGLHIAFVNSPHHYENLVDPSFRSIGVGVVRSTTGVIFVAEEFMEPRAAAAAPSIPLTIPAARTPISVREPAAVQAPAAVPAKALATVPAPATIKVAVKAIDKSGVRPESKSTARRAVPVGHWLAEL
jgi:hypothetical protein